MFKQDINAILAALAEASRETDIGSLDTIAGDLPAPPACFTDDPFLEVNGNGVTDYPSPTEADDAAIEVTSTEGGAFGANYHIDNATPEDKKTGPRIKIPSFSKADEFPAKELVGGKVVRGRRKPLYPGKRITQDACKSDTNSLRSNTEPKLPPSALKRSRIATKTNTNGAAVSNVSKADRVPVPKTIKATVKPIRSAGLAPDSVSPESTSKRVQDRQSKRSDSPSNTHTSIRSTAPKGGGGSIPLANKKLATTRGNSANSAKPTTLGKLSSTDRKASVKAHSAAVVQGSSNASQRSRDRCNKTSTLSVDTAGQINGRRGDENESETEAHGGAVGQGIPAAPTPSHESRASKVSAGVVPLTSASPTAAAGVVKGSGAAESRGKALSPSSALHRAAGRYLSSLTVRYSLALVVVWIVCTIYVVQLDISVNIDRPMSSQVSIEIALRHYNHNSL